MKLILVTFLCLLFVGIGAGQPKQQRRGKKTADASGAISSLQQAQVKINECYQKYLNAESKQYDGNLDAFKKCQNAARRDLRQAYLNISKRPDAIELLLTVEMENQIGASVGRSIAFNAGNAPGRTATDANSDSQAELQRLIVLQNQRIIELLTLLVKRK